MTVDASCRLFLLFLSGSSQEIEGCFGELLDSSSCVALDIFLVHFIFES